MSGYKFDKMEEFLFNFPDDLLFYKNIQKKPLPEFREINFIGMGGSGIAGRILSPFLKVKYNFLNNYYHSLINEDALNILISYSGNTEETLSFFEPLKDKKIIGISSGGKLEEFFKNKNLTHYKLPEGYPPRCALGLMFSLLSHILSDYINFRMEELEELKNFLEKFKENFASIEGECMDMAQKFYRRPLFVYTAYPYNFCALRIKTQLNENSNHFVHIDFLPEMNHNEIEGITNPQDIIERAWVLFIKGKYMHERNKRRIDETLKIIENNVMGVTVFEPEGENLLQEIFYIIYFFDFVSIHLAKLNNVNPFEIKRIEALKKALKD